MADNCCLHFDICIFDILRVVKAQLGCFVFSDRLYPGLGFKFFFKPPKKLLVQMGKCDEKTNTGEGGKDKRVGTTSDDAGGKSVSQGMAQFSLSGSHYRKKCVEVVE